MGGKSSLIQQAAPPTQTDPATHLVTPPHTSTLPPTYLVIPNERCRYLLHLLSGLPLVLVALLDPLLLDAPRRIRVQEAS